MTALLIAEPPLQVLPTLARRVGLHEAIVLQQVHYLSLRSKDAEGWVQKTTSEWCDVFCFMSERSIVRAFTNLREQSLLVTEIVATASGRQSRVRVNHEALDAAGGSRQDGVTGHAKMARGSRQDGVTPSCNKGTAETTAEEVPNGTSTPAAARPRRTRRTRSSSTATADAGVLSTVFGAWLDATGGTNRTILDDKRRRIIRRAIKDRTAVAAARGDGDPAAAALQDCVDAVRGWRHSSHHRGENRDKRVYNQLSVLLRDNDQIETFAGLERRHGGGGNVAGQCPGRTPPAAIAELWAPVAAELKQLVPAATHDVWLATLHLHGEHEGSLVVGVAPEVAAWVGDRFHKVLVAASGGRKVTVVECDGKQRRDTR